VINQDIFPDGAGQYTLDGEIGAGVYPVELMAKVNPETDATSSHLRQQRNIKFYKEIGGEILPKLKYTEEEFETITTLSVDIKAYVTTYTAQIVTGQESLEDTWDNFQKTLKDMGVEELQAAYKAAYDRATAE